MTNFEPKYIAKPKDNLPLDHTQWPWVSINDGIPNTSGVYIISIIYGASNKRKLMYVGMSRQLSQRLASHPVILLLKALGFTVKVHFMKCYEPEKWETHLIQVSQPPLNNRGCFTQFSIEKMIKDDLFGI